MTHKENLLVILAEECSELAKEASKALRFGLDDTDPNEAIGFNSKHLTNEEKIVKEFTDIVAIMSLLQERGYITEFEVTKSKIDAKIDRVEFYTDYSVKRGTVE